MLKIDIIFYLALVLGTFLSELGYIIQRRNLYIARMLSADFGVDTLKTQTYLLSRGATFWIYTLCSFVGHILLIYSWVVLILNMKIFLAVLLPVVYFLLLPAIVEFLGLARVKKFKQNHSE